MHEIFDLDTHPETNLKKPKKNKLIKFFTNKKIVFLMAVYILGSLIYTTITILINIIKLF